MAAPALPRVRVPHPHVRSDSQVLAGSPHVIGSRVPVRRLWAWHRGGASVETLLKRYPNLGPARVLDALAFAYDNAELIEADLAREQALFEQQGGPTVGARPLAQLPLPFDADEDHGDASVALPPVTTPRAGEAAAPERQPASPARTRAARR